MGVNVLRFDFLATDKASPTFKKLENQSDSLGTKMLKFGKVAGAALGTATIAAGGLAVAGISLGVKTAAGLEQAQIGFTSLLKSGTKAKDFLTQLKSFAATTPFELNGLIESSRTLIGVGLSTKQTMNALKSFGDAASAVGVGQEAFQRIMIATSQAVSAGKFGIGDLNQIVTNGIPMWKILSDATGKPVSKLRDLATAGKLLSKDVLPVLEKQMNKDYGGAMAKQSMTLNGLWSTFTDTLSLGLAQAVQPMIPALKTGLTNATNIAAGALKALPGILNNITAKFKIVKSFVTDTLVPGINTAFGKVGKKLPSIDLSGLGKHFQAEAKKWGGLIVAGVEIGLDTGDWSGLGTVLGDGLRTALLAGGGMIKKVGSAVGDALAKVDWVNVGAKVGKASIPFVVGFLAHFTDGLWSTIRHHPFDMVLAITTFLAVGKIGGALAKVVERIPILRIFAPMLRRVESLSKPINNVIGKLFKFLGEHFGVEFMNVMPKIEGQVFKRIKDFAETIALKSMYMRDAAVKWIGGLLEGAGRMVGKLTLLPFRLIRIITKPWADAAEWLVFRGKEIVGGLARGIGSKALGIAQWIGRIIKTVVNPWIDAGRWLVARGGQILEGLARGIRGYADNVVRGVDRVISAVRRPFTHASRWLYQTGREVLRGLRDGLYNGVTGAGTWAKHIGEKIIKSVKNVFGISSPSRVFRRIGSNLIQSLFSSMVDSNPTQAITRIFGGMPQALGALVDSGMIKIAALPGKAMGALAGLGGKWASKIGGFFGGGVLSGSAAERWIIAHESGGRTTARNPTSTAFGLGQLLIANRQYYGRILGVSPNTTDYGAQMQMFRMYVRDRYGTAENAMRFWQGHHWYDKGGLASGPGWMAKRTIEPERVLSPAQTRSFDQLVRVLDRGQGGAGGDVHYYFPNYIGSQADLVRTLTTLNRQGRLDAIKR